MSCEFTNVYFNNDHRIVIEGLEDADGTEINDATITYEIFDSENTAVSGTTGTLTAEGTGGNYNKEVDKAVWNLLTSGGEYYVRLTGSSGTLDFEFEVPVRIGRRR